MFPASLVAEHPDELTSQQTEQRMVNEVLTPVRSRHGARAGKERLQSITLRKISLFQLFGQHRNRFHLFPERFLNVGWRRLHDLTIRIPPDHARMAFG